MESVIKSGLQVFYRQGTADESVLEHSFEKDIFLKAIPEYQLREGHTIIDIGAHIGTFSLLTASLNKTGIIYAIEPCQDTYDVLEKNMKENRLDNVLSLKMALSGKKGEAKLYYDIETGNWGHSITHQFSDDGELVATDTLDSLFLQKNIHKCDFIKFNCEGSEFEILLGASSKTLAKIDKMLVLYHMDLNSQHHISQVISKLRDAGFYTEKRYVSKKGKRGWLVVLRASKQGRMILILKHAMRWSFYSVKSIAKLIIRR